TRPAGRSRCRSATRWDACRQCRTKATRTASPCATRRRRSLGAIPPRSCASWAIRWPIRRRSRRRAWSRGRDSGKAEGGEARTSPPLEHGLALLAKREPSLLHIFGVVHLVEEVLFVFRLRLQRN